MAHENHSPSPPFIRRTDGYIGKTPRSDTAEAIRRAAEYARGHWGQGQIYTYTGPYPRVYDQLSPDYDHIENYGGVVEFPVILHSPPKVDTSVTSRQLAGAIFPWRAVNKRSWRGNYTSEPIKVYWRHLYSSQTCNRQLWRSDKYWPLDFYSREKDDRISKDGLINLFDYTSPNLFLDGACEMGTSDLLYLWDTGNGAAVSHDTSNYHTGSQSLKVLCTGTANPYATGPYLDDVAQMVTGARYTMSCWAKGDGSAAPKILSDSTTLATGTSSTSWQKLEATFTAEADVLKFEATTSTSSQYVNFDNIEVKEIGNFRYEPDGDGEFSVGFLGVERMCVASLAIFTAPDRAPTDDQVVVTKEDLMPGRAIRGYTGTGQGSIGDLEFMAGKGGSSYDVDDVERNTRRCLLQSGHPLGLSTDEYSSYYNIRGGNDSYFKVTPRNLTGKTTGSNVSTIPCLYGYTQGAAVGNEGYVKYTALTSGDTWTYAISSDAAALWTDTNRLDVDAVGDYVKIEFKAPPGGYIVPYAYSIWEDAYDQ